MDTRKIVLGAAIAGLISAGAVVKAHADEAGADATAAKAAKHKHHCKNKNHCKGKDSCKGKHEAAPEAAHEAPAPGTSAPATTH